MSEWSNYKIKKTNNRDEWRRNQVNDRKVEEKYLCQNKDK